jgi:hypothetical protein
MRRLLPLLSVLALSACGDWNEKSAHFDSLAEFKASEFRSGGYLPEDLLPPSARNINVKYNRDTTQVEAEFDFGAADRDAVVKPFLSFDQLSLRMAVQVGVAPPSAVPSPSLLLRCGPGPMEFLRIEPAGHAHYWTEADPTRRASACTNNASRSMG